LAKIKVEQLPQDALRCGLSGVASFVRSDVAKVVNANCPRRHLQVTAGTFIYPNVLLNIAFNMTKCSIPVLVYSGCGLLSDVERTAYLMLTLRARLLKTQA
jgi:hypothetical protein